MAMPAEHLTAGPTARRHAARFRVVGSGQVEDGAQAETQGHAWIAANIIEDPDITPHAFRVYSIIRLHDYGRGGGCFLSRQNIALRARVSEAEVSRALRLLRTKGYITTEERNTGRKAEDGSKSPDGHSTNVHYCTDTGVCVTPPTHNEAPEDDNGYLPDTPGYQVDTRGGVCVTPKVTEGEVNELSKVSTTHVVLLPEQPEAHQLSIGVAEPSRAEQAAALCVELRIKPTPGALKAMEVVIKNLEATAPWPLADLAVQAAEWLERHPKRQHTVAFFCGWVNRAIAGPPVPTQSNGHHTPSPVVSDPVVAERKAVLAARRAKHLEKNGDLIGFE